MASREEVYSTFGQVSETLAKTRARENVSSKIACTLDTRNAPKRLGGIRKLRIALIRKNVGSL